MFNLRISIVALLSCCNFAFAQADSTDTKEDKLIFLFDDNRQKLGDVWLSYQIPQSVGDNFVGQSLEGKSGYNVSLRCFLFKQFFVGYTFGSSKFDVLSPSSTGNINSVSARESFFNLGYEFLPLKRLRLATHVAVIGDVKFINDIDREEDIMDTGSLSNFGFSLTYELTNHLSLFADYSFRKTKTDIEVPNELQPFFNEGTYRTINFGLRFSFGRFDAFDHIYL